MAQSREPTCALGWQRLEIAAYDVDEHQLAEAAEHGLAAD